MGEARSQEREDAVGIMFSSLVRAHCRRQDVTSALAEVAAMEAAGGEPSPEIFLCLLDACAIARPPLLRELETVWARIEVSARPMYIRNELSTIGIPTTNWRAAVPATGSKYRVLSYCEGPMQQLQGLEQNYSHLLQGTRVA